MRYEANQKIQNSFLRRHYPDQVKGHERAIPFNLSRRSLQRPCVRLLRFGSIIANGAKNVNGKLQRAQVAAVGHGDEVIVGHHDVVCQEDVQGLQGVPEAAGGLEVGLGGEGHAAGVVVGQDD